MKNGLITDAYGNKCWYEKNQRHRIDGPAIEHPNGYKAWYQNGVLHRIDGPAVEWSNGNKEWWVNGKRHRLGGPAVEYASGYKGWWENGVHITRPTTSLVLKFKQEYNSKVNDAISSLTELISSFTDVVNDTELTWNHKHSILKEVYSRHPKLMLDNVSDLKSLKETSIMNRDSYNEERNIHMFMNSLNSSLFKLKSIPLYQNI